MELQDPIQFDENIIAGEIKIAYSDLMEISQGGPVVGDVSINNVKLKGRFGGPVLFEGVYMYIPIQAKRFLGTGFKLARVNLNTLTICYFGKTTFFIYLEKIIGNKVYYFEDIEKTIKKYYVL